ncbi:hypothetical protein J1N35_033857 [Gossypium stocksii]|uniref:CCHC-type domain-containing protein n=1 Tax=Gossypium stocksii TaxID=47602 RepID=A0A9D3ZPW1_9ROSI|nr:hypothetical protein J1N35_033857 [Gossypium stocksii]
MYRVLKSIWFTKEPVTFVSMPDGHFLDGTELLCTVKYERLPIFCYKCGCIGHETKQCQSQVELDESDLKFGNWLRVKLGQSNSYEGIWPNGVEILRNDVASKMDDEKRGWIGKEEYEAEKGKGKLRVGEGVSDSISLNDRRPSGIPKEGGSRIRSKRKKIKGCNGEGDMESPVRIVRRKLSDGASPFKAVASDHPRPSFVVLVTIAFKFFIIFLSETKAKAYEVEHVRIKFDMDGCFVVDAEGRRGGLAILWKNETKVTIKNFSNHHIDSLVFIEGMDCFRFMGFYGFFDLNNREQSLELLRRVGSLIHDDWIIGGNSNAILNDEEKVGMEEFGKMLDELALMILKHIRVDLRGPTIGQIRFCQRAFG